MSNPSRGWPNGSTRAYRRVRALVLERDGYACQVRTSRCSRAATVVHHTLGRAVSGDDPRWMVASCSGCNLAVGEPFRRSDPAGVGRTAW